jgi:solute carrier family 25 (mitochondrial citrate transporter), member 1
MTFDAIKNALADSNGKLSPGRGITAGIAAGCVESVLAVTPTERLKTALYVNWIGPFLSGINKLHSIDDAKSAKRFRNTTHAMKLLIQEQGVGGLYKGLASTTMKQSATSGVRMGSYNFLKEVSKSRNVPQNTCTTFGLGAFAGIITVYATQPFDTIKTRTQSARGASTSEAFNSIFQEYGVRGFWKGSTMRLSRLVFSGGIVFSVYEQIVSLAMNRL